MKGDGCVFAKIAKARAKSQASEKTQIIQNIKKSENQKGDSNEQS